MPDNSEHLKTGTRIAVGVWKLIYVPLFRRAARQILRGRLLDVATPTRGRWLESDIKVFLDQTWARTEAIMPIADLDALPDTGNRHNVFLAATTIAAFQIMLERGVSADYAMTLVSDLCWKVYSWIMKVVSLPFRLTTRDPRKRMARSVRASIRLLFSAPGPPGYEVTVWTEGSDTHTHWTHCPPQTFVRRLIEGQGDRGELEAFYQSWCLYDWVGADILSGDGQKGHYSRPHALSRGDSVCDMCWHGCAKEAQEQPGTGTANE